VAEKAGTGAVKKKEKEYHKIEFSLSLSLFLSLSHPCSRRPLQRHTYMLLQKKN
jgi:hypothetical protein